MVGGDDAVVSEVVWRWRRGRGDGRGGAGNGAGATVVVIVNTSPYISKIMNTNKKKNLLCSRERVRRRVLSSNDQDDGVATPSSSS